MWSSPDKKDVNEYFLSQKKSSTWAEICPGQLLSFAEYHRKWSLRLKAPGPASRSALVRANCAQIETF